MTSFVGLGCGGGDGGGGSEGPPAQQGTVNEANMKGSVTTADNLRSALAAPDANGESIAGGALQLSNAGMGAIGAKNSALTVVESALTAIQSAQTTTGTKTCTATGCTFDKYGSVGFTMTGSVQSSDAGEGAKKVVWDLTGTATNSSTQQQQMIDFKYTWKGDITLSATSINGQASGHWGGKGSTSQQGQTFNYEYDYGSIIKFNSVTVADKAPTGGSIYAKWWVTAKVNGMSVAQANQAFEGTKTFP